MPKRPEVSPGKLDREIFAKQLPDTIGTEEQLRSWLKKDFGSIEHVLVLRDDLLSTPDSRAYIRFEQHDVAKVFLDAEGGSGEFAVWSEAERASRRSTSVYGSDIHTAFLGEEGEVLRGIKEKSGASRILLQSEVQKPVGEGLSESDATATYAPQLHFSVTCEAEKLEHVRSLLASALESFHDRAERLLRCYGGTTKERTVQKFCEITGEYFEVEDTSGGARNGKDDVPAVTPGKCLVWDSATGRYNEEDLPEEIQDLICLSGPATAAELSTTKKMVKVKQELFSNLARVKQELFSNKPAQQMTPETPLHSIPPGTPVESHVKSAEHDCREPQNIDSAHPMMAMPVQSDEGSTSFEHSEDGRNPKRSRSSEAGPTALNPQFSVLFRGDSGASSSQWQPREQYEHQWWRDQGWGRSQWEQDQQEQSSWWRDQWSNQSWQWQEMQQWQQDSGQWQQPQHSWNQQSGDHSQQHSWLNSQDEWQAAMGTQQPLQHEQHQQDPQVCHAPSPSGQGSSQNVYLQQAALLQQHQRIDDAQQSQIPPERPEEQQQQDLLQHLQLREQQEQLAQQHQELQQQLQQQLLQQQLQQQQQQYEQQQRQQQQQQLQLLLQQQQQQQQQSMLMQQQQQM
jgi:hypothetical protein